MAATLVLQAVIWRLVSFMQFFGEPFSSDYYAGLPSETALYLQRIAQEVVLANLVLWNRNQSKQPAG